MELTLWRKCSALFTFLLTASASGLMAQTAGSPPLRAWTFPVDTHLLVKNAPLASVVRWTADSLIFLAPPDSVTGEQAVQKALGWLDAMELAHRLRYAPPDSLSPWFLQPNVATYRRLYDARPHMLLPDPEKPLAGWRIAIDPGHMAGDLETARMEGKFVCIQQPDLVAARLRLSPVFEANLTLATAWMLHDSLEALGATVLMTRTGPGRVNGMDFDAWRTYRMESFFQEEIAANRMTPEKAEYFRTKAIPQELFQRVYNADDLRHRAAVLQAFEPHITLIIHYNVHEPHLTQQDKNDCLHFTDANYCMGFIPGSFLLSELANPEDRAALLRLIGTRDLADSRDLTAAFVRASTRETGVPPIDNPDAFYYLRKYSLPDTATGVYARNLQLARLVGGAICYGESLIQENKAEYLQLARPDMEVHGIQASSRLEAVARAYLQAVKEYVASKP